MTFSISATVGDGRLTVATDGNVPDGTYTIAGDASDDAVDVAVIWSNSSGTVVKSAVITHDRKA